MKQRSIGATTARDGKNLRKGKEVGEAEGPCSGGGGESSGEGGGG